MSETSDQPFAEWIGREMRSSDRLDEALANRWLATFDMRASVPGVPVPTGIPGWWEDTPPSLVSASGLMPQGIHFALCSPDVQTNALGEDGHPARDESADSFLPPFPMPRRMWASSKIEFRAPLTVGAVIERTSRVASIAEKEGGSGKLAFVNVTHETRANGTLSVLETQTLVYRDAAAPDAPLSPPALGTDTFNPADWDTHRAITPDPRLLFRYSALTFNTHRIHYDAPYAEAVERYRGLVVHGPLTASLLLQLAARELGENKLKTFEFRGMSPAIAGEPLHLVMRKSDTGYEIGAFADDGRQVTKAKAT